MIAKTSAGFEPATLGVPTEVHSRFHHETPATKGQYST